ncbi:hypothetical protein [Nocardiopsis aegyptia]|uniref:Uncharacterized protein n=1 Tax=Nocardiopsis aegyptia TaxID=220378 RepID=A0A7Z0JD87_9ACTN|nr:hypothetical protein [Nocardiopsis aegyptia]NYJ37787.1 hypothetical protein [Nocardiopsis aegyptia]
MTQHSVADDVTTPRSPSLPPLQFHKPGEDLAAAMACERCKEQGISIPPGWGQKKAVRASQEEADQDTAPKKRRTPPFTFLQWQLLHRIWDKVTADGAGDDPDSRLLALTCALRGAIRGYANLTAQDFRILRLEDPHDSVRRLVEPGWLQTTPEEAVEAQAMAPAQCGLPTIQGNPWGVGQGIRSGASGWVSRTLSHKKMRKKPNGMRMTAVYVAAHATPEGDIRVPADKVVSAVRISGTDELMSLLVRWEELGWIEDFRMTDGDVIARLTELTRPLAHVPVPPPTPPMTAPATTPQDVPVLERARALVEGRESEVADWVGAFRDEHGHGPSWGMLSEHFGWPPRAAPDHEVTQEALRMLEEGGWLTGFGVPFGLRRGSAKA